VHVACNGNCQSQLQKFSQALEFGVSNPLRQFHPLLLKFSSFSFFLLLSPHISKVLFLQSCISTKKVSFFFWLFLICYLRIIAASCRKRVATAVASSVSIFLFLSLIFLLFLALCLCFMAYMYICVVCFLAHCTNRL